MKELRSKALGYYDIPLYLKDSRDGKRYKVRYAARFGWLKTS
jgi:hypothetical protein